jgi:hypothetical protein
LLRLIFSVRPHWSDVPDGTEAARLSRDRFRQRAADEKREDEAERREQTVLASQPA